jgi:UDP-N-acetylmuramate dehydrogenase
MFTKIQQETIKFIDNELELDAEVHDLSDYSTIHTGGPGIIVIGLWLMEQLEQLLSACSRGYLKSFILGAGSNVLFPDQGLLAAAVTLEGSFHDFELDGATIRIGAGSPVATLISLAKRYGVSGLEMMVGIPGTVGGAIMGNSGSAQRGLAELATEIELRDPEGRPLVLGQKDINPIYRSLNLPTELQGSVVTSVLFILTSSEPKLVKEEMSRQLAMKRSSQPRGRSLGCVFKNPPGESAGRLIDQCGLKKASQGGAVVSDIHANFILNKRKARSIDVIRLAAKVRDKVLADTGIELVPEIKILDPWGRDVGLPPPVV